MSGSPPRISCLTITRNRPERLRRAVDLYLRQTWPNKELVVVVDRRGPTEWIDPVLTSLGRSDIRVAVPPPVEHIGALRNHAVDLATGEYVATWDDDDLYHPLRLEVQARALESSGKAVCFLADYVQYFEETGELFLDRWNVPGLAPSLMCARSEMPRYVERVGDGALGEKGSDQAVNLELTRRHHPLRIYDVPYLYTYVVHGSNLWDQLHYAKLAFKLAVAPEVGRALLPGLRHHLREYVPFPLPEAVLCKEGARLALPEGGPPAEACGARVE